MKSELSEEPEEPDLEKEKTKSNRHQQFSDNPGEIKSRKIAALQAAFSSSCGGLQPSAAMVEPLGPTFSQIFSERFFFRKIFFLEKIFSETFFQNFFLF